MRIIEQIIKEFWIQTILSFFWGIYKVNIALPSENKVSVFIANFGASLFLLSWFLGQVTRVKKQHKIEDEFSTVKTELNNLLIKLEKQTENLVGYSTGGDSLAYFTPVIYDGDNISLELLNSSNYPVFDFSGYWIDLDEQTNLENGNFSTKHIIYFPCIYNGKIIQKAINLDMTDKKSLNINLFAHSRSGRTLYQSFRIMKIDDCIKIAHKTESGEYKKIDVPKEFPGYSEEDPEIVFK